MDAKEYSFRVIHSEETGEYIGLCQEFPSLTWPAATKEEALTGITGLIRDILDDIHEEKATAHPGMIRYIDSQM